MPLWRIYCHPDTFTDQQKAGLSESITKFYAPSPDVGLPPFYVVVAFVPLGDNQMFVGGKVNRNMVRITVEHIARQSPSPDTEEGLRRRVRMMDRMHTVR